MPKSKMMLKLSNALLIVGAACVFFLGAMFGAASAPAWIVQVSRFVLLFFWVPYAAAGILRLAHHFKTRRSICVLLPRGLSTRYIVFSEGRNNGRMSP